MGTTTLLKACTTTALLVATIAVAAYSFCKYQIHNSFVRISQDDYVLIVKPGTSLQQFANQLQRENLFDYPVCLRCYGIVKNRATLLKAGEYKIENGMSARQLFNRVVDGKVAQYHFAIIEGRTVAQVLATLEQHPKIKHTLTGLDETQIIQQLQIPVTKLEGVFLPDTYYFTSGTSDVEFLRRAYNSMQLRLRMAWDARSTDCILETPYDALILASIIEKESGYYAEYPEISGVYQRRLMKKMRLQADPTIIYGLGKNYSGQITKADLQLDTPYNTYTRAGLPPTPIALPSMRAIHAALNPQPGDSLYFVAGEDGKHVFSRDLQAHNTAVHKNLR